MVNILIIDLKRLFKNIYVALKAGGKACLCVPQMIDNSFSKYLGDVCVKLPSDPKTGVEKQRGIFYPFDSEKGMYDLFAEPLFTLENFVWSVETILECMQAVGFIVSQLDEFIL